MKRSFLLGVDPVTGARIVYRKDGHIVVVSRPGGGKTRCIVMPNLIALLDCSMVVIDINGELTRKTCRWREANGHDCYVHDWHNIIEPRYLPTRDGRPSRASFNPIQWVIDAPMLQSQVRAFIIAEALILNDNKEHAYWADGARSLLVALIMHVAFDEYYESCPANRTMGEVWRVFTDPDAFLTALACMAESGDPFRATQAHALIEAGDDNREMQGIKNHLRVNCMRILSDPGVIESMRDTSLPAREFNQRLITHYICIPGNVLSVYMRAARMLIGFDLFEIEEGGKPDRNSSQGRTQFIIDECAALRDFPQLIDAAARLRNFGVQVSMIYQTLTQMRVYGDQWQTLMGTAGVVLYFSGTADSMTAREISGLIGKYKIKKRTDNFSSNNSGGSFGTSDTPEFLDVLRPDQIANLPAPKCTVTFVGEGTVMGELIHPSLRDFPEWQAFQAAIDEGYTSDEAMAFSHKVCADIAPTALLHVKEATAKLQPKKNGSLLGYLDRLAARFLGDDVPENE